MMHEQRSRNDSLGIRFFVFFVLYFVQGIPYGFQTSFLPILFRSKDMDLAHIGLFKLLMMPWLLKPLWAPLVDNYLTNKFWLNVCLLVLSLLCVFAAFSSLSHLFYLSGIMFLFNIATSLQDIALDSVVIGTLRPSQLAQGNIAQVVGYKMGGLFSGGIFTIVTDIVSWHNIFFTLAIIYVLGFIISVFYLPEEEMIQLSRRGSANSTTSVPRTDDINAPVTGARVGCYVWDLFQTDGTLWMLIYILFYKVGEIGTTSMSAMFMLDNGISPHTAGFWTGFTGQAFSVLGSILGGLINSRHPFSNIKIFLFTRALSILSVWLTILTWTSSSYLSYACCVIALQSVYLSGGFVTTSTYTLAMTLSQKAPRNCRASHYTMITTVDVLGRLLFSSLIGGATQWLGYSTVYSLFTLVSFLLLFHLSVAPSSVSRH